MSIQKVSEIEGEPVVGKFYLVPCVQTLHGRWVPIIGPRHEDSAIIDFPGEHYHRDLRFLPAPEVRRLAAFAAQPRTLLCAPDEAAMITPVLARCAATLPVERRMRCKRRMPDFPLFVRSMLPPFWMQPLQRHYENASAKCGRCPHKGFSLKGLPAKDGKIICPGHGLQFDVNTGKLVPREFPS